MHPKMRERKPVRVRTALSLLAILPLISLSSGCSLRTYAINMVGDALASGDSVYESDEDLELVGDALPFGLKLTPVGRLRRVEPRAGPNPAVSRASLTTSLASSSEMFLRPVSLAFTV